MIRRQRRPQIRVRISAALRSCQMCIRDSTLSEAEQKRWRLHCSDYFSRRLPDYVPRLEALAEQNQGNERNFAILKSLYHYLENL